MAKPLGCSFRGKRSEMGLHTMNFHLAGVMEKVSDLSLGVVSLRASNEELRKQVKEKDKRIDKLERKMAKFEALLQAMSSTSRSAMDDVERDGVRGGCHESYSRGVGTLGVAGSAGGCGSGSRVLKKSPHSRASANEIEPKALQQLTSSSSSNSSNSTTATVAVSMLRETTERQDSQIMRLRESVQGIQQSMTQYSIAVDELRLRQDVQDVKTTNGVFIWKIPDVRRRYRDAIERKTISLYSPPFQTSAHGYRMCVRVYLHGDGSGKGSFISVFFVLMRSEHDDLLGFPFKQSVRFTLLNQVNQAESITEAFSPDLKSQSFQKPEGEMNVASGFPKFARQTVLQDERFTKGNVIYIKAQVDLTGLALE